MWFPGLMYSEAYDYACTVDDDTVGLVLEAYNHDQISWEEAERQWWEIIDPTVNPSSNSDSVQ